MAKKRNQGASENSIDEFGLNISGWRFKALAAIAFVTLTENQTETDRYWNAIVDNDGQESNCGWCKDKWEFHGKLHLVC